MKMGSQELLVLKNEVHGTKSHQPLQSLESRSLKQSYLRECDNSMFFASTCGDVLLLTEPECDSVTNNSEPLNNCFPKTGHTGHSNFPH